MVSFVELSSPADFRSVAGISDSARVINLKGYGSGLNRKHHDIALAALGHEADVVVWDGDWFKSESFTMVLPSWLQGNTSRRAIAFRKAEGNRQGFIDSWANQPESVVSRVTVLLVPAACVKEAEEELRALGTPEGDVHNTALGWFTLHASGSTKAVAIGGGKTCANEAMACLALKKQSGKSACEWQVLDVARTLKTDQLERPAELLAVVARLQQDGSLIGSRWPVALFVGAALMVLVAAAKW